jgi:hypothetical protein
VYAEILRTEGFNAFRVADASALTAASLAAHDVVVLPRMALGAAPLTALTDWVNAGGSLIAMAPDATLGTLLGLSATGTTLADAWFRVDTAAAPGAGITGLTMQFHGTAQRYTLAGATALATLYGDAATATAAPALTLRTVGAGRAAAFAWDVATSIVTTRQGNRGLGGAGARRPGPDPLQRQVLRCRSEGPAAGLGGPLAPGRAAGRRAAAAAVQPHRAHEPGAQAAAPLLAAAARREGGRGDDGRRPPATAARPATSTAISPRARPAARWPTGSACVPPPTCTPARR